jgi:hypothetical protein
MVCDNDAASDNIARMQSAMALLLICALYACAVQYSLVSDAITLHAARRAPTETGPLLKLTKTLLIQRNLSKQDAKAYLLGLSKK